MRKTGYRVDDAGFGRYDAWSQTRVIAMAKKSADTVLDQARGLPEQERLRLVEELLFDLDGPPPIRNSQQLQADIDRRTAEVKAGTAELLTIAQVKELRARRRGK